MSLSGNLGFVSLDEVLRLLNRSNQRGMVDVRGDDVGGRIFFERGGVTLATTLSDDELTSHISRSETPEGVPMAMLLREMAVETLHQLGARGHAFEVVEDKTPDLGASSPFDLEELLADARRRYDEWAEVSAVVTDLDSLIRIQRDLGERDRVTIDRDSWRLISEIGSGASVRTLARELGTTDFWAARVAAGMIEEELLGLKASAATGRTETAETPAAPAEDPAIAWPEPSVAEPVVAAEEPVSETAAAVEELVGADSEAEQLDTQEAPAETDFAPSVFAEASTEEPATTAETSDVVDPNASWWTEPEPETPVGSDDDRTEASDEEVEEDTEAFLEKVFSGLESDKAPQEEGYGLLRRRRLGALRDLSNDG